MAAKRRRRKRRTGSLVLLALIVLVLWTLWGNTALVRTDIEFSSAAIPAAMDGFVIAQVSDLHDAELGKNNADIVDMLSDVKPDLIVLTGDMIDSNRGNIDRSVALVEQLIAIAPVYYCNGNHEAALSYNDYHRFTRSITEAGAVVLEDRSEVLTYHGAAFQLIGLNDLGFLSGGISQKRAAMKNALTLLNRDDLFSIVLSHRPELMEEYTACGADLVFCGHAHGGQARLPLIGGLYSPGQGLFPKYDAGLYRSGKTSVIVSRGLGNSTFPLRFNNRPEIVVVTLRSLS